MRCLECGNQEVIQKENHPDFITDLEIKKESASFWSGVARVGKKTFNTERRVSSFEEMINDSLRSDGIDVPAPEEEVFEAAAPICD